MGALALQIAAGIGLASCAGLRAFLPLFAVGAAGRAGWIDLARGFEWLASTPALVVLGTAVVAEILADKVPAVDHLLDSAGIFVRPAAGALVMASALSETGPLAGAVLGLILGTPAATGVQLLKAKARLVSSAATGGLANPAQSALEDVASVSGCLICLLLPVAALALLALVAVLCFVWLRRRPPTGHRPGPASGSA